MALWHKVCNLVGESIITNKWRRLWRTGPKGGTSVLVHGSVRHGAAESISR